MKRKVLSTAVLSITTAALIPCISLANSANTEGKWFNHAGKWYYGNDIAHLQKEWIVSDGDWYYLHRNSGELQSGWLDINGKKYFLNTLHNGQFGKLLTGWQWIDGYCYFFEAEDSKTLGELKVSGLTKDGYTVDENGHYLVNSTVVYEAGKGLPASEDGQSVAGVSRSLPTSERSSYRRSSSGSFSGRSSTAASQNEETPKDSNKIPTESKETPTENKQIPTENKSGTPQNSPEKEVSKAQDPLLPTHVEVYYQGEKIISEHFTLKDYQEGNKDAIRKVSVPAKLKGKNTPSSYEVKIFNEQGEELPKNFSTISRIGNEEWIRISPKKMHPKHGYISVMLRLEYPEDTSPSTLPKEETKPQTPKEETSAEKPKEETKPETPKEEHTNPKDNTTPSEKNEDEYDPLLPTHVEVFYQDEKVISEDFSRQNYVDGKGDAIRTVSVPASLKGKNSAKSYKIKLVNGKGEEIQSFTTSSSKLGNKGEVENWLRIRPKQVHPKLGYIELHLRLEYQSEKVSASVLAKDKN